MYYWAFIILAPFIFGGKNLEKKMARTIRNLIEKKREKRTFSKSVSENAFPESGKLRGSVIPANFRYRETYF